MTLKDYIRDYYPIDNLVEDAKIRNSVVTDELSIFPCDFRDFSQMPPVKMLYYGKNSEQVISVQELISILPEEINRESEELQELYKVYLSNFEFRDVYELKEKYLKEIESC